VRAEDLQDVIKAQPFKPFAIIFADGAKITVPHPEWILHPRGARTAVVMEPETQRLHIIDVMLVQRLELEPPVTVELELPGDFPKKHYDAVHARVTSSPRDADAMFHYGGAWNAVRYRFVSCARSDETFANSVRTATLTPGHPERFIQEDALFGFFVNGLSVIESFFYGLYWIGSMVDTTSFPVRTKENDLKKITVEKTVKKYIRKFSTCPLTDAFSRLTSTDEYDKWKDIRNILAHRAHYGRAIVDSIGGPGGVVWRCQDIPLTDQFTTTRRQWLASTLAELMKGAEIFVGSHL
jgi:hypothetical protein